MRSCVGVGPVGVGETVTDPAGVVGIPEQEGFDTVVDPGANGLYEFEDQSDAIPQRIYPNYDVCWSSTKSSN